MFPSLFSKVLQPNYEKMKQVCNLWRNWDDINDSWDDLTNIMKWFSDNQDRLAKNAGPGHWNDPDMVSKTSIIYLDWTWISYSNVIIYFHSY